MLPSPEQRKPLQSLPQSVKLLAHFTDKLSWKSNEGRCVTCSGPREIKSADLHHLFLRQCPWVLKTDGCYSLGKKRTKKPQAIQFKQFSK